MTRRVLLAACLVALACASAWAGSPDKAASAKQMEMMKAEMAKCAVCKEMAAHLDEIGPMKMDVVKMNNGMAIMHSVVNPKGVVVYHQTCEAIHKAGAACMTMTDEQAKTALCPFCQGMRGAMKAGAKMSMGMTKKGDLMVVTSDDPVVQAQISALETKCEMMTAGSEPQAAK